jgi:hypothetical protein
LGRVVREVDVEVQVVFADLGEVVRVDYHLICRYVCPAGQLLVRGELVADAVRVSPEEQVGRDLGVRRVRICSVRRVLLCDVVGLRTAQAVAVRVAEPRAPILGDVVLVL